MPGIDELLEGTGDNAAELEAARLAAEATAAAEQAEADRIAQEERDAAAHKEPDDMQAKIKGLEAGIAAERKKRQDAEALLGQRQAAERLAAEEEDPYAAEIKGQLRNEFTEARIQDKIALSYELSKDKYDDFDEKIEQFIGLAQGDALLTQQMRAAANPALYAYKYVANQQKMKDMADPEAFEKGLRAKIEAEMRDKVKKELEAEAAKRGELPGSLAGARGAAGTHTATWSNTPR